MVENENLYIKETFFANKVLSGFDDDVIFWHDTSLFSLGDDLHVIFSRTNPFEKRGDDTDKVRFEFCCKMIINQFCKIWNISKKLNWIKLKIYREVLNTWKYIVVKFKVNLILGTYYSNWSKLLLLFWQIHW
jgi:hypothetical protein